MPKRTISHVFYSYPGKNAGGDETILTAWRGETVDLSAEEAKRGDALGAFGETIAPEPEVEVEPLEDAVDYSDLDPEHLEAEVNRRGLEVEGTGKNGNVLKKDYIAALEADDA